MLPVKERVKQDVGLPEGRVVLLGDLDPGAVIHANSLAAAIFKPID